jgi:predicted DNA binding CopG/RHH family protein
VKLDGIKKETQILIRMSKGEKEIVEQQAKGLGLSLSAYIRMLIYREEKK